MQRQTIVACVGGLLTLLAWGSQTSSLRAEEKAATGARKGETGYIEYWPGDLPVILSAPHGGRLTPSELPNRTTGRLQRDAFTVELATAMRTAMQRKYGAAPHLIVCHLARVKLDANREIKEAAQGNATAEKAWHEYHDFISEAEKSILQKYPKGLYLDIHGHSHDKQRVELGYLLGKDEIQWPPQRLNLPEVAARSSIRLLDQSSDEDFAGLLRGPSSLGGLLEQRGVACVPAPGAKVESADLYFNGGYNTETHGSMDGVGLDAIQLEVPRKFRNEKVDREALARALADALSPYFEKHFKMPLIQEKPAAPPASSSATSDLNQKPPSR
ncbi:N-formylglutamate amidohydrolase [Roseimicrobium sp. ORNL1]|uniref:N-formylglutamate amidohydrolase n=1 Tax=Roseimicrobium sp. ORNL1 TaxID=2711231 RepID=UPI0013E0EC34|nr:N-formylglutamate amidohydrolase [Roseimicrobium sp. ORNL1]QIF00858.1 N-formylglutamate amidohydrolase [Roseimicrobium sp. ORNL1]